jgi:hypothetical protein
MATVIGPVLTRTGGCAFDVWMPEQGLSPGYVYSRIEDAYYARKTQIRCPGEGHAGRIVAYSTVDQFLQSMV